MNLTAASRTATTAQSVSQVLFVAVEALEDGRFTGGCCPKRRMFELVQAGLRLLLIGAASVVLALTGIILSVVAAARRAYDQWKGIPSSDLSSAATTEARSPLLPTRDRDRHAPRKRRAVRRRSTDGPLSPIYDIPEASTSRTPPRSPLRASPEPMLSSEDHTGPPSPSRQRGHRRRLNPQLPEQDFPSIDSAIESTRNPIHRSTEPTRPPMNVLGGATAQDAVRALSSPVRGLSDSSGATSTEVSLGSEPADEKARAERSPPPKRVLQRLKEHHNHLRDRCLTRVHSMPIPKPSKPARRTDPYQAPYYFPTPLSPDVGTYVEQVRVERRLSPRATEPVSFRQYWDPAPLPSPRTSPKSKTQPLPPVEPEIVVSGPLGEPAGPDAEPTEEGVLPRVEREGRPALREVHHRWSWHLPLRPHLPRRSHSPDAERGEDAPEKQPSHAMRFFGHTRRRHGTASEDIKTKRTALSPQA